MQTGQLVLPKLKSVYIFGGVVFGGILGLWVALNNTPMAESMIRFLLYPICVLLMFFPISRQLVLGCLTGLFLSGLIFHRADVDFYRDFLPISARDKEERQFLERAFKLSLPESIKDIRTEDASPIFEFSEQIRFSMLTSEIKTFLASNKFDQKVVPYCINSIYYKWWKPCDQKDVKGYSFRNLESQYWNFDVFITHFNDVESIVYINAWAY